MLLIIFGNKFALGPFKNDVKWGEGVGYASVKAGEMVFA